MNSTLLKLLVVEDDPIDAKSVCRILDQSGLAGRTDRVDSMAAAKESIRREHYDAVILDLGLPDAQGVDGIIELQASAPELPIVVLSGLKDEDAALRGVNIGAEDFISKGKLTSEQLCRSLLFAVERHQHKRDVYQDLDSLKTSLGAAVQEALTDSLTGLPNRRALARYLHALKQRFPQGPVILGFADIDHFKTINDSYGHDVGDRVLQEFSRRLHHCLRDSDFVARVGGDEFLIVFSGARRHEALKLSRRILTHLASSPIQEAQISVGLSATLVLSEAESQTLDLEEILKQSHGLMEKGKTKRNVVLSPWDEASLKASESSATGSALFLEEDFERLFFQSLRVRDLRTNECIGHYLNFEFTSNLARYVDPIYRRAHRANRLHELTLHCMGLAAKNWEAPGPKNQLHLDLESDLVNRAFCGELTRLFGDESSRRHCVLFFHSQSGAKGGSLGAGDLLLLRHAGFKIGIRGIGDGETHLEALQSMAPDYLRLDPSLTHEVSQYEGKQQRLWQLLKMLQPLGAPILAAELQDRRDAVTLSALGLGARYAEIEESKFSSLPQQ